MTWTGDPGIPNAGPPAERRPNAIPLGVKLFLIIGLPMIVFVVVPLLLYLGFRADFANMRLARRFFSDLAQHDSVSAFGYLSTGLQREVGTPEALGRRWDALNVTIIKLGYGCSGGTGEARRIGLSPKYSKPSEQKGSFSLGQPIRTRCTRTVNVDLVQEGGTAKILAIRADF
jgi:hypothetical protein